MTTNGRTTLMVIVGVFLTVTMALLMSQLDTLQQRLGITPVFVVNVTVPGITNTPLLTIALPTITPSPIPTQTPPPVPDPRPTAVAVQPVCGNVPAGWVTYVVRPGDTLYLLSVQSGATIQQITLVNCLKMSLLLAGAQIFLPNSPPPQPPCGPPAFWVRYQVQSGDTMFSLARSRGTTVYAVLLANCRTSSYLYAGSWIYLPPLPDTPTWTPSATLLPSDTPTLIFTVTPPASATPSPTVAATVTPTISATPTQTAVSPTLTTPSVTPTPTETLLPDTPTATATSTPTASDTPVATATSTSTWTDTPTTTPTETAVPTDTPTATPLPSDTPTLLPPTATSTSQPTETPTP